MRVIAITAPLVPAYAKCSRAWPPPDEHLSHQAAWYCEGRAPRQIGGGVALTLARLLIATDSL